MGRPGGRAAGAGWSGRLAGARSDGELRAMIGDASAEDEPFDDSRQTHEVFQPPPSVEPSVPDSLAPSLAVSTAAVCPTISDTSTGCAALLEYVWLAHQKTC